MTEAKWLACTDAKAMMQFVRGKASERKWRLFACSCVRSIRNLLTSEVSRRSVWVTEHAADGGATVTAKEWYDLEAEGIKEAKSISKSEWPKGWTPSELAAHYAAVAAAGCLSVGGESEYAQASAWWVAIATTWVVDYTAGTPATAEMGEIPRTSAGDAERAKQVAFLHDLFGPMPFRRITVRPAWLTPAVLKLAQTIYNKRTFKRLPKLADALEEVGCKNSDILQHCRQPAEHGRGCWVVDLILGKQ